MNDNHIFQSDIDKTENQSFRVETTNGFITAPNEISLTCSDPQYRVIDCKATASAGRNQKK